MSEHETLSIAQATPRDTALSLSYDQSTRVLSVESAAVSRHSEVTRDFLNSLGVYTKVESVMDVSDGSLEVKIRPAAGVELRDSNGTLVRRLVYPPDDLEPIRGPDPAKISIPSETLLEVIDPTAGVGYTYGFSTDGSLVLKAEQQDPTSGGAYTVDERPKKSRLGFSGVIAESLDLYGHGVAWSVEESSLIGRTTKHVPSVDTGDDLEFTRRGVTKKEVSSHSGNSFHFQTEIPPAQRATLGWSKGTDVEITLVRVDDRCALLLTEAQDNPTGPERRIQKSHTQYSDRLLYYIPTHLVYFLRIDESEVVNTLTVDSVAGTSDAGLLVVPA